MLSLLKTFQILSGALEFKNDFDRSTPRVMAGILIDIAG